MFDIGTALATGSVLIGGYGQGGFTVNGVRYESSILIYQGQVAAIAIPAEGITQAFLLALAGQFDPQPEIWLVGTGTTHQFLPASARQQLKERFHIGMDTMDTGAACRTYNILASESRSVAALLMAV